MSKRVTDKKILILKYMKQLELDFAAADKIREQQELDELYKPDPDEPWWNR